MVIQYQDLLFMTPLDERLSSDTTRTEFLRIVANSLIFFTTARDTAKMNTATYERDRLGNVILFSAFILIGIGRDISTRVHDLIARISRPERSRQLFRSMSNTFEMNLNNSDLDMMNIENYFQYAVTQFGKYQTLKPEHADETDLIALFRRREHGLKARRFRAVREVSEMCLWVFKNTDASLSHSIKELNRLEDLTAACQTRLKNSGLTVRTRAEPLGFVKRDIVGISDEVRRILYTHSEYVELNRT